MISYPVIFSQLLDTVEDSTTDVKGLHEKVDRMKAVESHNKECENTFQGRYHTDIQAMADQLKSFMTEQETSHDTHTQHIGKVK